MFHADCSSSDERSQLVVQTFFYSFLLNILFVFFGDRGLGCHFSIFTSSFQVDVEKAPPLSQPMQKVTEVGSSLFFERVS